LPSLKGVQDLGYRFRKTGTEKEQQLVPPAGIEPAAHGLGIRNRPVLPAYKLPYLTL